MRPAERVRVPCYGPSLSLPPAGDSTWVPLGLIAPGISPRSNGPACWPNRYPPVTDLFPEGGRRGCALVQPGYEAVTDARTVRQIGRVASQDALLGGDAG